MTTPENDYSLTDEERTSIAYAIYEGGSSREDYLAGIEHWIDRLLRERMAWAWDQGAEKASPHGGAYLRSLLMENPYRDVNTPPESNDSHAWLGSDR